jgi:hypothetical protein
MFIIAGQKLCGRVDQVPGKCYVKTRFLHFYYVPLIPLSSWVIEQGSEKPTGFNGQQISLSFKSVLFGWLQAGLVIYGLLNSFFGIRLLVATHPAPNNHFDGALKLFLGLICLGVWFLFTFWPHRANEKRAKELTGRLGIPYETTEGTSDESIYRD